MGVKNPPSLKLRTFEEGKLIWTLYKNLIFWAQLSTDKTNNGERFYFLLVLCESARERDRDHKMWECVHVIGQERDRQRGRMGAQDHRMCACVCVRVQECVCMYICGWVKRRKRRQLSLMWDEKIMTWFILVYLRRWDFRCYLFSIYRGQKIDLEKKSLFFFSKSEVKKIFHSFLFICFLTEALDPDSTKLKKSYKLF